MTRREDDAWETDREGRDEKIACVSQDELCVVGVGEWTYLFFMMSEGW